MSEPTPPEPSPAPPPRRRRLPRWARALLVAVTLVLVAATGVSAAGAYLLHRYSSAVHQAPLLGDAAATASAGTSADPTPVPATIDGPINILLLGTDDRAGDPAAGSRSDTIIIVHVDAAHRRAYFVSIPRDSRVTIPSYPKTGYGGGTDKINAAYAYGFNNGGGQAGGTELLALTLKQLTGLSFNAAAIVNFTGFQSVVNAVGGIDLCVDEKTISVHIGWDAQGTETAPYRLVPPDYYAVPIPGIRPQVYLPGCQHMTGWQALDYVRQRELLADGDYGRERHQQQFLKALATKLTGTGMLAHPLALDAALRAVGGALTFDGNGVALTSWLYTLRDLGPESITMVKTNAGQFNTQVIHGQDFEILSDTSLQLFQAVRDDTVAGFVAAHPDWVATSDPPATSPSPTAIPTG